jgi:hypothetical protein
MVKQGIRFAQKAAAGLAIVINDDIESRLEIWRTPINVGKKAYAQADCYDPSRRKDHISTMLSLKEPGSSGRKTLGGTDGSRTDEGSLVELKDCD